MPLGVAPATKIWEKITLKSFFIKCYESENKYFSKFLKTFKEETVIKSGTGWTLVNEIQLKVANLVKLSL
jgi:hypothetical protein